MDNILKELRGMFKINPEYYVSNYDGFSFDLKSIKSKKQKKNEIDSYLERLGILDNWKTTIKVEVPPMSDNEKNKLLRIEKSKELETWVSETQEQDGDL